MSRLQQRRRARNLKRMGQSPRLNLVALMDIFTILVLFLMVNNGDVEVLQPDKAVTLPESTSEQRPELATVLKITAQDILLAEQPVMTVAQALAAPGAALEPLAAALEERASNNDPLPAELRERGRALVVMGDADVSFKVLKRVMATCAASEYRKLSLAVDSRPLGEAEVQALVSGGEV